MYLNKLHNFLFLYFQKIKIMLIKKNLLSLFLFLLQFQIKYGNLEIKLVYKFIRLEIR